MKTLRNLFLDELADMYDAERRVAKALPKMVKAATSSELKTALASHREETEGHVKTLEGVFACFDVKAKGQTCEATVGLLEEAEEIMAAYKGSPAINAALICAAQKVEHYEMATYGCLREWAGLLGNEKAAGMLQEILDDEAACNEALTKLARADSNDDALGGTEEVQPAKSDSPVRGMAAPGRLVRPLASKSKSTRTMSQ